MGSHNAKRKMGPNQEQMLISLSERGGTWDRHTRWCWNGTHGTAAIFEGLTRLGFVKRTQEADSLTNRAYEITPEGRAEVVRIKAKPPRRAW